MFARNGITGECHRVRAQLEHLLGQSVMLPITRILKDKARRGEHVDLLSPFDLVDRPRKRAQMLALPLFLFPIILARDASATIFPSAFPRCRMQAQDRVRRHGGRGEAIMLGRLRVGLE